MRWGEIPHWVGHAGEYWSGARLYLVAGLILVLVTLFIAAVAVAASRAAGRRKESGADDFPENPAQQVIACATARGALLTPGEMLFYRMLSPLVSPRCLVFAKVRLADLFEVKAAPGRQGVTDMLRGKRIDFILCDPATSSVMAGLELDENAPEVPDRDQRQRFIDDLFASNGLPMFRVPVGANEDVEKLREFLASHELLAVRASAVGEAAGMI